MKIKTFKVGEWQVDRIIKNKILNLTIKTKNIEPIILQVEPIKNYKHKIHILYQDGEFVIRATKGKYMALNFDYYKTKNKGFRIITEGINLLGIEPETQDFNVLIHTVSRKTLLLTIQDNAFNQITTYIYY